MILTCPECATGYFVEDGQIKPTGRVVRCAACGHRWTAVAEAPLDLKPKAEAGVGVRPVEPLASDPALLTGEDLPRAFRDRAEEERRMRQAMVTGVAWGGAAIVLLVLVATAVLFREPIVHVWPQTASAYAAIGLPVNPTGLVIENVRAEPSLDEGHATLAVSGVIRNVTGHEVVAPPLRISLMNTLGKRVAGQIANLANARIPPGETRHFVTSIVDPPISAANLQVDFAVGMAPPPSSLRAGPAAPTAAPTIALRGLSAAEPGFSDASNAAPLPQPPAAASPASSNAAATPQ